MKRQTKVDGYKHVFYVPYRQGTRQSRPYRAFFNADNVKHDLGSYDDARSAAIAVDKCLIKLGKEPVNVLKRKGNEKNNSSITD